PATRFRSWSGGLTGPCPGRCRGWPRPWASSRGSGSRGGEGETEMPPREMFVRLLGVLGGLAVFASGPAIASGGEPARLTFGLPLALLGAFGVASQGWDAVRRLRGERD